MILLQGSGLSRDFGGDILFENVNISLGEHSCTALVGKNGVGKSTLLKILAGIEEPSSGMLSKVKNLSLKYLAQDAGLTSTLTIFDEMLTIFEDLCKKEQQLHKMEQQMSRLSRDELTELMLRYDVLSEIFRKAGGFTYESNIKSVLNGFHFPEEMWQQKISDLSGGQKTRLALAKMLLEKPQLLILDEPTNHLDIETLSWLENYLKNYNGALLIVSHDRYFLDKVVSETLELSRGKLTRFAGNYSRYIELKAEKEANEQKKFEKQQKEISKLEDYIARNLVRASTTKQAQSRRKKLEKMERLEGPKSREKAANILFSPEKMSGNVVLTVKNGAIGYNEVLSEPINIDERKGDSIAIVGPNGIGKTTLIKSIIGQISFIAGKSRLGTNVTIGYYDQEQGRLTASNTVLNELWNEHRLLPEVEIRNLLGAFLFSGDDVKKKIGMLSGGEKARLLLAKLAINHDNFLLLDEPTNHLDIDSREVLEQALIDFEGTILFVSHDRYFINRVATKVLELSPTGSNLYLGDYDYYLEKKMENNLSSTHVVGSEEESINSNNREEQKKRAREERKLQREADELEMNIEALDNTIQTIHEKMAANPDDFEELVKLQRELSELEKTKNLTEDRWMNVLEELE